MNFVAGVTELSPSEFVEGLEGGGTDYEGTEFGGFEAACK